MSTPKRRPWILLSLASLSALMLVSCLGLVLLYPYRMRKESDQEIAAAKKAGLPVMLAEIPQREVKTTDDARPLYRRAMKMATPGQLKALDGGFNSPATDREIKTAYATLPTAKAWLDLVAEGTRKPACSWPRDYARDGFMYPDDDLSFLRTAAKGLAIRARADNDAGRHGRAFQSIEAIYGIARHLDQAPTFIDKLAATSVQRTALRAMKRSLFVGADSAEVERLALHAAELPDWQQGYRTDFVIGLAGLQNGMLPYTNDDRSKRLEKFLSTAGIKDSILIAYVTPYRKAWERMSGKPTDYRLIEATMDRWKAEVPKTAGPLGELQRYVGEPSLDGFGSSWGRFLADRLLVADAARIRQGKQPKEIDPFTEKPFVRQEKEGRRMLFSPGPTDSPKDDLTATLP